MSPIVFACVVTLSSLKGLLWYALNVHTLDRIDATLQGDSRYFLVGIIINKMVKQRSADLCPGTKAGGPTVTSLFDVVSYEDANVATWSCMGSAGLAE